MGCDLPCQGRVSPSRSLSHLLRRRSSGPASPGSRGPLRNRPGSRGLFVLRYGPAAGVFRGPPHRHKLASPVPRSVPEPPPGETVRPDGCWNFRARAKSADGSTAVGGLESPASQSCDRAFRAWVGSSTSRPIPSEILQCIQKLCAANCSAAQISGGRQGSACDLLSRPRSGVTNKPATRSLRPLCRRRSRSSSALPLRESAFGRRLAPRGRTVTPAPRRGTVRAGARSVPGGGLRPVGTRLPSGRNRPQPAATRISPLPSAAMSPRQRRARSGISPAATGTVVAMWRARSRRNGSS